MSALSSSPPRAAASHEDLVRVFDAELARPEIEGIPIGSTLTDVLVIEFINQGGQWGIAERWLDRLRWLRKYYSVFGRPAARAEIKSRRILITWRTSTPRINGLLLPVLDALGSDRSTVLYEDPHVLKSFPVQTDAVKWTDAIVHDRNRWLTAFSRCWPKWRQRLQALSRSLELAPGGLKRLELSVLANSQLVVGFKALLERCRPTAIVTDYDRGNVSSCLVLAARSLGIPTFTLQHGVLAEYAVGYVPVVADRMFCWGEFHRRIMTAAGQDPARLAIGGCPRLSRDLRVEAEDVRRRMGISDSQGVVMLGTSPVLHSQRILLADWFCEAVSRLSGIAGIVRLHPSETRELYAGIARQHPHVQFLDNSQLSLDESLAAADVVVVQNSGLGSDALVKRRLTVVVEPPDAPSGHGKDLVEQAGCPRVAGPDELAGALRRLLFDAEARRRQFEAAEPFVHDFCAYFGADAARRISESVVDAIENCNRIKQ